MMMLLTLEIVTVWTGLWLPLYVISVPPFPVNTMSPPERVTSTSTSLGSVDFSVIVPAATVRFTFPADSNCRCSRTWHPTGAKDCLRRSRRPDDRASDRANDFHGLVSFMASSFLFE